ncbi:MAG: putative DNA-binding domain-containing protein [Acidobacteriota bacterium]|jgi:hypothetical protein
MSRTGSNLPGFREVQLEFAAHIRDPDAHPRPADVDQRRMQIYVDLFYNNIEGFLGSGFPVAKRILTARREWRALVREFVARHGSSSPYFLDVSQEFLTFLSERATGSLPPYLLELCHYEWVELALSVSERELPSEVNPEGDLLRGRVVVSPLIWMLSYRYPVHLIGPSYEPDAEPDEPTLLVVNRRRDDSVGFLVVNPVTWRLLELLGEGSTGSEALERLARELDQTDPEVIRRRGIETLGRLREAQILLGTVRDD